jgi:hypothetical protein
MTHAAPQVTDLAKYELIHVDQLAGGGVRCGGAGGGEGGCHRFWGPR